MTEVTTSSPAGDATTVDESSKPVALRGPDGKFASATPAEVPAEAAATTEPDASAPEAPEQKEQAEPEQQKRNRTQERIDRLTAEKHAALREVAALKERFERIMKDSQPRQVDPNDFEGQQRETFRAVLREDQTAQTREQFDKAMRTAQAAQFEMFNAKIEAARERIPNLDASLQTFAGLPVSDHAAEIIAESDKAAEIAHYLANNPREAYDIARMTPAQQGRALARIEHRVSLPARRTSNAPTPPPTLTGSGAPKARAPSEMGIDEMQAHLRKAGVIR